MTKLLWTTVGGLLLASISIFVIKAIAPRPILKMKPTEFDKAVSIGAVTYYRLRQELSTVDWVYTKASPEVTVTNEIIDGFSKTASADGAHFKIAALSDDAEVNAIILVVEPLTFATKPKTRRKVDWQKISATLEQIGGKQYVIKVHTPK